MKHYFLPAAALIFSAALAVAQPAPQSQGQFPPGPDNGPPPFQETITVIQGVLDFVNGRVAVKTGEITYYIRGLDRLFGFVDGLKEGATVTLEGYAVDIPPAPEYKYFLVEKLAFNGKEYDGLLSERRAWGAFSGGRGFPGGLGGSSPPGAVMRDRRPQEHQRYYYYDRRRDKD